MRALVTGGAGFIGSSLVERLIAEGHVVDVVDDLSTGSLANLAEVRRHQKAFSFTQLDVRDPALLELFALRRPEVVFHLAGQTSVTVSIDRPLLDAEVNVLGGLRVLEGARAAGTRKVVVAASGGSLYDDLEPGQRAASEVAPQRPRSPYGVAKRALLDYLACYRELYGLEYTALALGNVYGPRQDASGEGGVVAVFVSRLLSGRRCAISGDGAQTRDFVYVDDVVDAFSRAADRGSGLVLNIGTGVETSIGGLYGTIAALLDSDLLPTRAPPRVGEVRRSVLDVGRAAVHLDWRPWTSLDEGLRAVVEALAQKGPVQRWIAVLCGGVGAARLLCGARHVVPGKELLAVVNTGDDLELFGLSVCPDLDTITYTLAGESNPTTGWGRKGETFRTLDALSALGAPSWFRLGDLDLATHLYRSGRLAEGATLSRVTAEIASAFGLELDLRPMSDHRVRTRVVLQSGEEVAFQEYFVRLRHEVAVQEVHFDGASEATAAPGVLAALARAEVVVIAPSNPVVSIAPILAVPGIAEALAARRESVVAISPIVGGVALKGPADRLLVELGGRSSADGVAQCLVEVAATLVIDDQDAALCPAVEAVGMVPVVADTVIRDEEVAVSLTEVALRAGRH